MYMFLIRVINDVKQDRKEINYDIHNRIIADNSIVIMPGVSSVDAHSKLITALNMVDSDFYLVGMLSQGVIIKGDFQTQYL